jgi:hypothetical protein
MGMLYYNYGLSYYNERTTLGMNMVGRETSYAQAAFKTLALI